MTITFIQFILRLFVGNNQSVPSCMCVNEQLNWKQSANFIHALIKQFTIPRTLQFNTISFIMESWL